MSKLPLLFNVKDCSATVFGGGQSAYKIIDYLLSFDLRVFVVAGLAPSENLLNDFVERVTIIPQDMASQALDVSKFAIIACRAETNRNYAIDLCTSYGVIFSIFGNDLEGDFSLDLNAGKAGFPKS